MNSILSDGNSCRKIVWYQSLFIFRFLIRIWSYNLTLLIAKLETVIYLMTIQKCLLFIGSRCISLLLSDTHTHTHTHTHTWAIWANKQPLLMLSRLKGLLSISNGSLFKNLVALFSGSSSLIIWHRFCLFVFYFFKTKMTKFDTGNFYHRLTITTNTITTNLQDLSLCPVTVNATPQP